MSAMKKWFPSKWLAADDITENQIVTVKAVQDERVGTDQEEKGVIYFDAFEKGVILNRTNADALAAAFGEDDPYNDWLGARVQLFTEMVRNPQTRLMGPAIRMRPAPKKKAAKETANDETPPDDEAGDPGNWGGDEAAA